MKNLYIISALAISLGLAGCAKVVDKTVPVKEDFSYKQSFDDVTSALNQGWLVKNVSTPTIGSSTWDYASNLSNKNIGFAAQDYSFDGNDFIATDYTCSGGSAASTASNWLISPKTYFTNGSEISFYSRVKVNPATYADRLQLRANYTDDDATISKLPGSLGKFTTLLVDINPTLVKSGTGSYPATWTKYTAIVSGLTEPVWGRFAFRYFVVNTSANSNGVGIDAVSYLYK